MKIPFSEVASEHDGEPSDFYISLAKLLQQKVIDVEGYITTEFDDKTFKICNIILEDGTKLGCGGEHDLPYIEDPVDRLEDVQEDGEDGKEDDEEDES